MFKLLPDALHCKISSAAGAICCVVCRFSLVYQNYTNSYTYIAYQNRFWKTDRFWKTVLINKCYFSLSFFVFLDLKIDHFLFLYFWPIKIDQSFLSIRVFVLYFMQHISYQNLDCFLTILKLLLIINQILQYI